MPIKARCYCEAVQFELDEDVSALSGIFCHCRTCQKLSNDRSYNITSSEDKLKVTKGTPKVFDDQKADSGKSIKRSFCGDCGSALFSKPSSRPGAVFVKVGVLDEAAKVKPGAEIYVDSQLPLIDAQSDFNTKIKRFEGMMAKEV
ncbi:BZ3500_MvSof-1268-A1-R1_Chr5-2g07989 [Microbotryum saponariae]|uniref:BZ3500_MvSof-1268-A1-R1_Chr5-2g07989 protein n=1 Tax=Microbotryum saponariae TaxID=289078 RepID=A0A2X0L1L6_9BASI|nr:BZ3500_MvSof-1268-A1-R1_Chr5-2g07989 [Microbotryum saponariae]SDA05858.1 BZ3501_MvSof-1269-A2-R1_Chr5-2g07811 [Microbotryum saponariae]